MSVDVLSEVDGSAGGIDSTTLVIDLSRGPVAVTGVGSRACNPSIGSAIDTPEIASKVEADGGSTLRNDHSVRSSELERRGLSGVDVGGGKPGG